MATDSNRGLVKSSYGKERAALFGGVLDSSARAERRFTEMNNALAKAADQVAGIAPIGSMIVEVSRQIAERQSAFRTLTQELVKHFEQQQLLIPENYLALDLEDQIKATTVAVELHFCLAAGCSPAMLGQIIEASEGTSCIDVILDQSTDVLDYCCLILSGIEATKPRFERSTLLLRAIEGHRLGQTEGSQALATVVWDSHATQTVSSSKTITVMKALGGGGPPTGDETLEDFYLKAYWAPAIASYPSSAGKYSRSSTIHEATVAQLTEFHSLCAISIATGLLYRDEREALAASAVNEGPSSQPASPA